VSFELDPDDPVFVAGHRGLVGSAIVRRLQAGGHRNLLTAGRDEVDLRDQAGVRSWMEANRPRAVYLVAGTVGGIMANSTRPAEFLYDNLMIHANVVDAARDVGVAKLLYLGSSCIYPRMADQPIVEPALLTGPLEPTNEAYAIAKIAGIKMCDAYRTQYGCDFVSAMPTNLYGPNDNFDLQSSHVLPALIRKFDDARRSGVDRVTVWGTGTPRREFLHVDDLADACVFLMERYEEPGPINVGFAELAELVRDVVHPTAAIDFDTSKPDGTPRKLLDSSRLQQLGWRPSIPLAEGVASTYEWYLTNVAGVVS
jgi:GDP-L-fucose synthase